MPASSDTKFHVLTIRGMKTEIRVDGVSTTGATNTQDISSVGPPMYFCNGSTNVEIAELVIVKGTLSDPDVVRLESYLQKKFKL